jgi:transglutaminase-like putative cysteine protease
MSSLSSFFRKTRPEAALALVLVLDLSAQPAPPAPESRAFRFEYSVKVTGLPQDAKSVRAWIPLPQSDENQAISGLKIDSRLPYRETQEGLYGNRLAYFEVAAPPPAEIPITLSFDVKRTETGSLKSRTGAKVRTRALERDRLVPLEGEVERRARQATAEKKTVKEKARGIYERVLADVSYDKTVDGWGRGDVAHVCAVGKGNCSDFHALFIGMARSSGIPALFEIGFPVPVGKAEGTVGGYHCWAWYEEGPSLWRPVDASEADKDPSRTDYFFGTLCCNRVAFSRGRDLVLEPPQAGEPLNFFIYPYVEVDGKADVAKVEKSFSFKDAAGASPRG